MEVGTTTSNLTARLPIFNPGDYDLWLMRIEQYFLMTDYSLWEVIKNGNKVLRRTVGTVEQVYEPTTAKEKQDRRNEMKARTTLLMALPNKNQLKFHSYQDAKLLMEAIEKRYRGNKGSKKVQRTLLKQQYENFAALSSEIMDQTFDRLQKLISQLEIQGEVINQEDMNLKLLRSLPSEWKTHANNNTNNTNKADNTAHGFSTTHTQCNGVNLDNLCDAVIVSFLMDMLTIRARRFIKRIGKKLDINGQRVSFDKSKVECFNCHKHGHFVRECRFPRNQENKGRENTIRTIVVETPSQNALDSSKMELEDLDWSYHAEEVSTTYSCIRWHAFTSSGIENKGVSNTVESNAVRMNNTSAPIIEDWNSDDESEIDYTVRPSTEKIKSVKTVRETDAPKQNKHNPRGNQRNWNNLMSQRLGSDFKMTNKACYDCGSFEHLHYVCDKKVERTVWNNSRRVNHKNFTNKMTHPHPKRSFVPQAVLTKSGKLSTAGAAVNTVRPVNTANTKAVNTVRSVNVPEKPIVNHPRTKTNAFKRGYSQSSRPFNRHFANKNSIINTNVNTARVKHTTARDRVVVSENKGKRANAVKASACWVWKAKTAGNPQQKEYKEKAVIDNGRISRKGKIKTGSLDFDDVYFCKELMYNLFSVSQICDKKNIVLFTDTECLVLSSDFKLLDKSQVLLRVPREDNIYSVDLKSIVPTGGLTCLTAKATIDESNTWHRR
ncbi:ribonuclease H-like domain-containing protein, partial [Tanacetum coccineum]